jgi:hypothetical protein
MQAGTKIERFKVRINWNSHLREWKGAVLWKGALKRDLEPARSKLRSVNTSINIR